MSTTSEPRRPTPDEYDPVYEPFVSRVPEADVVGFLRRQRDDVLTLFGSLDAEQAEFRYAPDKWSAKEVLGHVLDTEWVFTGRVLRFARGDSTPLPGLESSEYVRQADFGAFELRSVVDQFAQMRTANLLLFESFDEAVMNRRGTASNRPFTVRSKLFFMAGHAQHHLDVVRERYL